jgi:hypothetical protein
MESFSMNSGTQGQKHWLQPDGNKQSIAGETFCGSDELLRGGRGGYGDSFRSMEG